MVFNVFGSRDLPRDPQETQEPPKKHPKSSKGPCKKLPKKIPKNASVVKNALSRRSHRKLVLDPAKASQICTFLKSFFTHFFLPLFRKMLKLILEPSLGSERPKRTKMSPKEPSGAERNPKSYSFTNLKKTIGFRYIFKYRHLSRRPQEEERREVVHITCNSAHRLLS